MGKKRKVLITLLISLVFYGLFTFVWFFFAGISIMMFDSPGSENDARLWLLTFLIWAYPIGAVLGIVMGWIHFAKENWRKSLVWNGLPLLWVLPILSFLIYANFLDG